MVPNELKQLDQWVVWRWEHDDRGKPTKPPSRADGQGHADSTDPTTWTTAKDAYAKWKSNGWAGLGFVVTATDPYCGIDCDHCRDPETGAIDIWAQQLVEDFGSYTEITPTKTGIRIWTKAVHGGKEVPHKRYLRDAPNPQAAVEIYDRERYFTTTGDHLPGTPETIEEGQEALDRLAARLWPPKTSPSVPAAQAGPSLQAREIIDILSRASNSAKFGRLMAGDCSDYPSGSEADLGLLGMIVPFYTEQLDVALEIIRASGLWDDKWKRRDYQERTFEKALGSDSGERYQRRLAGREIRHTQTQADVCEEVPQEPETPWPLPSNEIFHGLAGRLAQLVVDYVESDDASILVQILSAFGTAAGIRPYFMVGATKQSPAIYTGLIGRTSRGRKGTGNDAVECLFNGADIQFASRIISGVGSGEMLVHLVRDPQGDDPGASDRRLLLREPELARLLVVVNREGSTLSHYLREAFDGKPLHNAVKRAPASATTHHIGMIGHCTPDEVRDCLTERQVRNGLANRIGWFLARRERKLPKPPIFEGPFVDEAIHELKAALKFAQATHKLDRSTSAWKTWEDWYNALPDDEIGLVAAITGRAEALVSRWSMIYALMDQSPLIEVEHLTAAFALYDYELACVEHVWGGTTGDPVADRILEELRYGDLTQTEIFKEIFQGNLSASVLERVARDLEHSGRVQRVRVQPAKGSQGGRPTLLWRLKK